MSGIGDILAGYESLRAGQEALHKDLHQQTEAWASDADQGIGQ
jgi:hypothetical protein